jgi:hypothetical protein
MSTIRCDGCGEYREWDGYTLVKGCSCLGKIGEPTVYDELELLKADLRKIVVEMEYFSAGTGEWAKGCELATKVWKERIEQLLKREG